MYHHYCLCQGGSSFTPRRFLLNECRRSPHTAVLSSKTLQYTSAVTISHRCTRAYVSRAPCTSTRDEKRIKHTHGTGTSTNAHRPSAKSWHSRPIRVHDNRKHPGWALHERCQLHVPHRLNFASHITVVLIQEGTHTEGTPLSPTRHG